MSLGQRGGNGGTVSQVRVLGDWDEELDPGDWWVVSQGSTGERGEKGKKGKKRKREKEGGTFRVPGELLFRTPEEAEAHLRAALEERDDGDNGDDGDDEGDEGDDKGHEATDTWLPNAPVSQATGHCHAKFNQFLVLCINHDWNVPLCTCSQVCSAYETPIL